MIQKAQASLTPGVHWEAPGKSLDFFVADSNDTGSDSLRANIIAEHTAIQPSRKLRVIYALQSFMTGLPIFLLDMIVSAGCLVAACYLVNLSRGNSFNPGIWNQLPAFLLLQWVLFSLHQLYPGAGLNAVTEIRGIVRSTSISLICLSALNIVLGQLPRIEFVTFAFAAVCTFCILPFVREFGRRSLSRTRWWGLRLVLVGRRDDCIVAMRQLSRRRSLGYIPVGFTSDTPNPFPREGDGHVALGCCNEAVMVAKSKLAPVVGLVSPPECINYPDRLVFQFPSVVWLSNATINSEAVDTSGLPGLITHARSMPFLRFVPRLVKRAIDLMICIPAVVVLAIPMALVAAAIRIVSPGPIFYGSVRVGQHGELFRMWKFRTMVPDAALVLQQRLRDDPASHQEWKSHQKLRHDPRIIPVVGTLLRRWSLDELPQLWNVINGEMSLVGPRPVPEDEIVRYESRYYEYTQMWPGITGLWQVSGRNDTSFETRIFLVHHYATNWSPWLDAWILIKTPAAVLTKRGAY